jgi:hypothetical protein
MRRLRALIIAVMAALVAACTSGASTGQEVLPPSDPAAPSAITSPAGSLEYDSPEDLRVGDCFDPIEDKDDLMLLAVHVRPCTELHRMEAFGLGELTPASGAPFPGDFWVEREAERLCDKAFEDYVGIPFDESRLDYAYYVPYEWTWDAGDRRVLCAVEAHPAQPLADTVRDSER